MTYRRCCAQVEGDAQYDEQMDVEIMRVLITSYYNIVRKHFQDAVPKVHCSCHSYGGPVAAIPPLRDSQQGPVWAVPHSFDFIDAPKPASMGISLRVPNGVPTVQRDPKGYTAN